MSYQVGIACFASAVGAGSAACSQYVPVSSLVADGAVLRSVSCTGVDPSDGALLLQVISTPVDGSASSVSYISQTPAYGACLHSSYLDAAEIIAGALLAAWVSVYGLNLIRKYFDWSRGT